MKFELLKEGDIFHFVNTGDPSIEYIFLKFYDLSYPNSTHRGSICRRVPDGSIWHFYPNTGEEVDVTNTYHKFLDECRKDLEALTVRIAEVINQHRK